MSSFETMRSLNILGQREPKAWNTANNGIGRRTYFLRRNDGSEYLNSSAGHLVRYSADGAAYKALELNKLEGFMR